MALNIQQKQAIVEEVTQVAASAHSAVAAEYSGITANDMNTLRTKAREGGVYLRVVKNTLAKRAIKDSEFECMGDSLSGPLILAFSQQDPGAAARVLKDFAKEHDKLVIKLAAIGGEVLGADKIDRLANLPNKEQAIAMLMGVMKAPIEKFVRTLAEPCAKLTRTIAAVADQKKSAGG